jgi:hypothetical protein
MFPGVLSPSPQPDLPWLGHLREGMRVGWMPGLREERTGKEHVKSAILEIWKIGDFYTSPGLSLDFIKLHFFEVMTLFLFRVPRKRIRALAPEKRYCQFS